MKSLSKLIDELKNGETDAEIARRANLDKSTLSRMRAELLPPNRNYLWPLSFALKTNFGQAKQLFEAGGLCLDSMYHMTEEEKKREEFLRKCLAEGEYDVMKINIELYERRWKLLGTQRDEKD